MATANERLRQGIVQHQVGLIRVSNGLRRLVLSQLQRTEADLRRQVADRALRLASTDQSPVFLTPSVQTRLTRLEQAIRDVRNPAFSSVLSGMRSELTRVAMREPQFLTDLIRMVSPVDLNLRQPDLNEIRKITTSRPFQGRLLREWTRRLAAEERRRIMAEIRIGLSQGQNAQQITTRIVGTNGLRGADGVTQLSRNHVQTLVRTAINHVGAAARREFALANKRLFKREQWIAVLDGRTSTICLDLNGNLYEVGKGPYPPAHLNCRSIRAPFIDENEAVRMRLLPREQQRLLREFTDDRSLRRVTRRRDLNATQKRQFDIFVRRRIREEIGARPAVMSTEDFLSRLPMDDLEDILGVTKAQLQRRGNVPLGRLIDQQGRPLNLDTLARKEAKAFRKAGLKPSEFIE